MMVIEKNLVGGIYQKCVGWLNGNNTIFIINFFLPFLILTLTQSDPFLTKWPLKRKKNCW